MCGLRCTYCISSWQCTRQKVYKQTTNRLRVAVSEEQIKEFVLLTFLMPKVGMRDADFSTIISYVCFMLHDLYVCVFVMICMCAWVCVSHRGMVGPLQSDSILGPLDVCCRLGPPGHTGQIVWSPSHQQELRGSINHRVLRGYWRRHTHTDLCKCALMLTDQSLAYM